MGACLQYIISSISLFKHELFLQHHNPVALMCSTFTGVKAFLE